MSNTINFKTPQEWIKCLDSSNETFAEYWKRNFNNLPILPSLVTYSRDNTRISWSRFIHCSFQWSSTKQGYAYWSYIADNEPSFKENKLYYV